MEITFECDIIRNVRKDNLAVMIMCMLLRMKIAQIKMGIRAG